MATCPKCGMTGLPKAAGKCSHCGTALDHVAAGAAGSGTLDIASGFPAEAEDPGNAPPDAAARPGDATLQLPAAGAQEEPSEPAAGGAAAGDVNTDHLGTVAYNQPGTGKSGKPAAPEKTLDGDQLSTLDFGGGTAVPPKIGSTNAGKTVLYGNDQPAGGESGSAGRLKRMWAGAAGSSGNPMNSLRAEAQATDSVFRRVATRTVAKKAGDAEAPDYELIEKIGEGAMGVVYAARQKAIGRVVAIKAIKEGNETSDDSRRKFFYEAQITGELDHPNIVPIHELGASQDGMLFYSMKLIGGTEWQKVIRTRSRDQNLETFMKVADAMAFAHAKGVIHRDLKPENTMLGTYGEVFVTDWGLAVNYRTDRSFNLGGTPAYMAPEMAGHRIDEIGPGSDIYLLGAILFQIVTGLPPHRGQTVTQCLLSAFENEIIETSESDALLEIAYRAMEKQPRDRYPTVEAMQEAIRQYRRHAESIALAKRSEELVPEARKTRDYEKFSRAIFGYRDAMDLWPGNTAAAEGLKQARLAYGQCAFDQGDFDLCLQTLDQTVPAERELYLEAEKSKRNSELRESRFRSLRRVLAAVVLFGLIGMTALAGVAWNQRGIAVAEKKEADRQRESAVANEKRAIEQEGIAKANFETAEAQRALAVKNAEEALRQEGIAKANFATAEQQRTLAEENAKKAREQEEIAKSNFATAEQQRALAVENEKRAKAQEEIAVAQKTEADRQRQLAEQRTAEVELAKYQSDLALAKARIEQASIREGNLLLKALVDPQSYQALSARGAVPNFESWAWNRVNLLSNADLPGLKLGSGVEAMDFAPSARIGVVGSASGRLTTVRLEGQDLIESPGPSMSAPIEGVAIAPDGSEVVFSLDASGQQPTVFQWTPGSNARPQPVRFAGQRSMQQFLMTNDLVVGGINEGLWIWDRKPGWQNEEPRERIESVRGRLRSVQVSGPNQLLLVAELDDLPRVYRVQLDQMRADPVVVPETLARDLTAAATSVDGKVLYLGTLDGRIFVGKPGEDDFRETLPARHQSAIRSIRAHADGKLVSMAEEPVVQVWRQIEQDGRPLLEYENSLAGTAGNLAQVAFSESSDEILAIDEEGEAIVWNSNRQKQRNRLERNRSGSNSQPERYHAPVQGVVMGPDSEQAISVDQNGVLDTWSLIDGATRQSGNGQRWSWVGHMPGSELVDLAVDDQAGVLLTLARLPAPGVPEREYLEGDAESTHEICHWDVASGKMVRRWTIRSPLIPRISLLDGGSNFLLSSDDTTTVQSLADLSTVYDNREVRGGFATDFAVPHPSLRGTAMLVKRSGVVCLFDSSRPDDSRRDMSQADNNDPPQKGVWTADGTRFFLVHASGRIVAYRVSGEGVSLQETPIRIGADGARIRSHHDVDLIATRDGQDDLLIAAVRRPGNDAATEVFQVRVPGEAGAEAVVNSSSQPGRRFLTGLNGVEPLLVGADSPLMPVGANDSISRATERHLYVASSSSGIHRLATESETARYFGNPGTRNASASADASRIVIQGQRNEYWLVTGGGPAGWDWQPLSVPGQGVQKIGLAPEGDLLALQGLNDQGQPLLRTCRVADGVTVGEFPGVVAMCWDSTTPQQLAMVRNDGTVELALADGSQRSPRGQVVLGDEEVVLGIHDFTESWSGDKAPDRWWMVHSETDVAGFLQYLPDQQQPAGDAELVASPDPVRIPRAARVATSPRDGLFAVGSSGAVAIWFAAPTLGVSGTPLYDLAGHSGAEITALEFTPDGSTLVSADSLKRVFGWMSEDPWRGMVRQPMADPVTAGGSGPEIQSVSALNR